MSVLELVKTFEEVTGKKVAVDLKPRREGDIVAIYANPDLAEKELNWTSAFTLVDMCRFI